ncbi:ABC transporter substrate-binding protein [Brevibacillus fulvus]|uniref:MarR-like DNA-binding transcriptional regulator SgrR of sgrS sRNA n=1 Tax=Brevibacillus fulvus TaxID=1125967 RepID=A0A939BQY9_9BACL|nr:ABC transporter substrate-binding protein [Brevibacillus fulvus]MBM7588918.1 MarR-like DNA-binding transcriptional regulator SgrR of sgrS sRNA [Brevibacillus fulvus]
MRVLDDYLLLRKAFCHIPVDQPFQVAMQELADALYCSSRNAKLLLMKMMELQWIRFASGKGRGHMSLLTFCMDADELLLAQCKKYAENGRLEAAFVLLNRYANQHSSLKTTFLYWLTQYFGYQVADQAEAYRETLKLPIFRPIHTLDPAMAFYALDAHLISQIFNTLLEYDHETDKFLPGIAHAWEANGAKTEWTFYLRKGIRFHHGRELTAADVIHSLRRLRNSPHKWLTNAIEEMTLLSNYLVRIQLNKPHSLFLHYLSYVPASIVPADLYSLSVDAELVQPVGSGAYRVAKRTSGQCVLTAYDHYFQGRAHIDEIELLQVPEDCGEMLLGKEPNLLLIRTGEERTTMPKTWEGRNGIFGATLCTFNLNKPGILQNRSFRQAMSKLLDRHQLVTELAGPSISPAYAFHPETKHAAADNAESKQMGQCLLQQSGYGGETLHLYTYHRHAPDARWLQREYEKQGIRLEIHIVPWIEMMRKELVEQADLILFEALLAEGIVRMIEYFQSSFSFIRQHADKSLLAFADHCIAALLQESEPAIREAKLQILEEKISEEQAFLFLAYKTVDSLSHPSLKNVKLHPRGWVDFQKLWFQPQFDK